MKKSILFVGCLALLVAGCNKEQNIEIQEGEASCHLIVDITVDHAGVDTRAVKQGWEDGDKVFVVFDGFITDDAKTKAYYMTLTREGTSWKSEFSDPALEEYLLERESGTLAAAYVSDGNPVFKFGTVDGYDCLVIEDPATYAFFMYAHSISYSVTDSKLTANFKMELMDHSVQFFIDGIKEDEVGNYSFKNSHIKPSYMDRFMNPWAGFQNMYVAQKEGEYGDLIPGGFYKEGIRFFGMLNNDMAGKEDEYAITVVDNGGTPDDESDDVTYTLTKTATLNKKDAVKLPALDSGKWTKSPESSFDERLDEGYFTYYGVKYNVVKMKDGKWWMAQNLAYLPDGYTPATDLTAVTAGVFAPLRINEGHTSAEFAPDLATKNGYLYQAEVALGLKVGDLTSVADAQKLEGAQGICPKGWHIPTLTDIVDLVGKSVSATTNTEAPYYDGANGSIVKLNADGFNMDAFGAISIQDNTKTAGTFMGWASGYPDKLSSGMFCGSTYAGVTYNTSGDATSGVKNLQFYGFMPMTNKATEAEYTSNGTKVSYRIAGPVRCVRNE